MLDRKTKCGMLDVEMAKPNYFGGNVLFMDHAGETNLSRDLVCRKGLYRFLVVVEKDKDGYFAFTPELQGCYVQGESYEEVLENIKDAIKLHVEDRLDGREEIPQPESVSFTSLEVAV